jgi:hypothetical protein
VIQLTDGKNYGSYWTKKGTVGCVSKLLRRFIKNLIISVPFPRTLYFKNDGKVDRSVLAQLSQY